jgi:hypothetical protein
MTSFGAQYPMSGVTHTCTLPSRAAGLYHVVLAVWTISDTDKAFNNVNDVVYGSTLPNAPVAPVAPAGAGAGAGAGSSLPVTRGHTGGSRSWQGFCLLFQWSNAAQRLTAIGSVGRTALYDDRSQRRRENDRHPPRWSMTQLKARQIDDDVRVGKNDTIGRRRMVLIAGGGPL